MKRYKSTTILGGGPPGKIVQCQSFEPNNDTAVGLFPIYMIQLFNLTNIANSLSVFYYQVKIN